jgi:hypothetical protein
MPNQHIRDTAVYSVVRDEWPAVKAELERRLASVAAKPMPTRLVVAPERAAPWRCRSSAPRQSSMNDTP